MEKTSRKVRVSKTKKANLGRVITIAVSEEGLLIPRDILEGAQEVEIRREHETIRILPIVPRMRRMEEQEMVIVPIPRLTPFAFPLYVERIKSRLSTEQLEQRVARLQREVFR